MLERVTLVAKTDFRRLSYTDAIKVLEEHVASGKVGEWVQWCIVCASANLAPRRSRRCCRTKF